MVQWVIGSILYCGPNEQFLAPALCSITSKGYGMCYPIYEMIHIKELLLLIGKSSPFGGSGFTVSLSEWSFTLSDAIYP